MSLFWLYCTTKYSSSSSVSFVAFTRASCLAASSVSAMVFFCSASSLSLSMAACAAASLSSSDLVLSLMICLFFSISTLYSDSMSFKEFCISKSSSSIPWTSFPTLYDSRMFAIISFHPLPDVRSLMKFPYAVFMPAVKTFHLSPIALVVEMTSSPNFLKEENAPATSPAHPILVQNPANVLCAPFVCPDISVILSLTC